MIVACPGCSARYQIAPDRLKPEGVRLRCTRCEAVFRVSPPPATVETAGEVPVASTPSVPAPQPEAPREPAPSLSPPMSRAAPPVQPSPPKDRERMVLIADPEIEQGKLTASTLAQWGLQPVLVHDGVEAILAIQRLLPRAIVIDAALPKMFGFQICEIVKRNESLRGIQVVLVGAIHDQSRYRRPPEEIYGADAYIERQELPESLRSILQGFGMLSSAPQPPEPPAAAGISATPSVAAPAPARAITPEATPTVEAHAAPETAEAMPAAEAPVAPEAVQATAAADVSPAPDTLEAVAHTQASVTPPTPEGVAPAAPTSGDPEIDEKIAQAERLARIVVSDIVLYSKEKFDAAVEAGNVLEAMEPEIAEGRSLFTARIDPSVQEMRDFLTEELLRVAGAKGKP